MISKFWDFFGFILTREETFPYGTKATPRDSDLRALRRHRPTVMLESHAVATSAPDQVGWAWAAIRSGRSRTRF